MLGKSILKINDFNEFTFIIIYLITEFVQSFMSYAHYFRDCAHKMVDCTLVHRLTLNRCRNLDSVQRPYRNPDGSLVDRRVGNYLWFLVSIGSYK